MRRTLIITMLFYFAVALVATSPAVANPPVLSWDRGDEGSTFQEWYFSTDEDTPPAPDAADNPYGTPLLHVDTDHGWYDSIDGGQGVWALSGEIDIVIDNNPVQNPYKEIRIELVWKPEGLDPAGAPFNKSIFLPDEPLVAVTPFDYMHLTRYENDPDTSGWIHTWYDITIWPNPPREWITIKGNILVDSIIIDTICVPEPATIALLTLGSLCTLRARRRNR